MDLSDAQLAVLLSEAHKGRNVNGVTHDVNNALGAIMAYAELVQMDTSDPEARRMLGEIVGAAERGSKVLTALTTIARPVTHVPGVTCDVALVLESVELLFSYELKYGQIDAEFIVDTTIDSASIDAASLQRALMYVVANAVESMVCAGSHTMAVHAFVSGANVCIQVSNTGESIAPSVAAKMFESGFTTKGSSYLGMGLSIARDLVREAHGDLEFVGGSEFRILIPSAG